MSMSVIVSSLVLVICVVVVSEVAVNMYCVMCCILCVHLCSMGQSGLSSVLSGRLLSVVVIPVVVVHR